MPLNWTLLIEGDEAVGVAGDYLVIEGDRVFAMSEEDFVERFTPTDEIPPKVEKEEKEDNSEFYQLGGELYVDEE